MDEGKTNDECEASIRKFAEITGTDEAFAHVVLQDVDFDLDAALETYFSSDLDEGAAITGGSTVVSKCTLNRSLVGHDLEKFPPELTIISWNVDGLDEIARSKRFDAVLTVIAGVNPDIIFLQEMVPAYIKPLNNLMEKMYNIFISDPNAQYFCVTLVCKGIEIVASEIVPFISSNMYRSMTIVQAKYSDLKIALINTHLESCAEYNDVRKTQFSECLGRVKKFTSSDDHNQTLLIFGGDLNLRDQEVPSLPEDLKDAWIAAGSPSNHKYSWDMRRNSNKSVYNARCRFDRIYFSGPYKNVDFTLQGTQMIRGVNCYPSDHFAVVCRFYSTQ